MRCIIDGRPDDIPLIEATVATIKAFAESQFHISALAPAWADHQNGSASKFNEL